MRPYILYISLCASAAPAIAQPFDPAAPQSSLYDLRVGTYKTFQGGRYSCGVNQRSAAHEAASSENGD